MKTKPYLLHALSPLHAGTGHSVGIIDLPIARMRAAGIPIVPGSSIKGVLRDLRRGTLGSPKVHAIFGPEREHASAHAGALVISDARLLALPVRSFRGTFAWVTSPLLLQLARRDLGEACSCTVPDVHGRTALHAENSVNVHGTGDRARIYLEDLDLQAKRDAAVRAWSNVLAPLVSPEQDIFSRRFSIVDDETMTFLWETATQVDTRVRIDEKTRTVAQGALWMEESLPPETLLIGIMSAERSRHADVKMGSDEVLEQALGQEEIVQFGGKATIGRGRCRILSLSGGTAGAATTRSAS